MATVCQICGKHPVSGYNRPHSLHHTKKLVKPNLQKSNHRKICTACLRTLTKLERVKIKV